ncbi:hypothetical protein BD410DRAFT_768169 [Rickenella mellea]|uniref:GAR domain-containing protein n=1 Tax=Rickenella mellea TaxID=50990 RepID=A0A4Y7Q8H4_9AGAM|nr:hypothetical protein BD410DRAFT_768169 [Rickenella mellea]
MIALGIAPTLTDSQASLGRKSLSNKSLRSLSNGSASSSQSSLLADDDENDTITANRVLIKKDDSSDELRLLAVSTHITELSYSISDIQTRIFEIQELRHQSQGANDAAGSSSSVIDQALMNLDEKLEAVGRGMKAVNEAIEPLTAGADATPKQGSMEEADEHAALLRKHVALISDWEAVQDETEVLREELKEDKWLTVFRTVSEQADGMMSSLEKAVQRCQDFIWQVHRGGEREDMSKQSKRMSSTKQLVNYETYCTLLESFEAKKKHYMPATTKVLSIIDKGVQDRVTKNGECLRRHAESTQRWRTLRDRISRTEAEMEVVRNILINKDIEPSEAESVTSRTSKSSSATKHRNGSLATPPASEPARSRAPSQSSTLSRSMSPFRKLARKFASGSKTPGRATPTAVLSRTTSREPSTEPAPVLRHRSSFFPFRNSATETPAKHKYSQSLTPDSSPSSRRTDDTPSTTVKVKPPRWNSSTKVGSDEANTTVKPAQARRPSATHIYSHSEIIPPVPPLPPRSVSRTSYASSRPWSPVTSSASTQHSTFSPQYPSRPPSPGFGTPSRARPKTPSRVPKPVYWRGISSGSSDASGEELSSETSTSLMQRFTNADIKVSPPSPMRAQTPGGTRIPGPRPPSRSMIPIPTFHLSSASRPNTAMSQYDRPGSSMSFRSSAARAQTPEHALRARVSQLPYHQDIPRTPLRASNTPRPRPSLQQKLPPSSFRDSTGSSTPGSSYSRPSSRSGAYTPGLDAFPTPTYGPVNKKDPLDVEIATIVNSTSHGLLVERVDPPLRTPPREGEELKAQYAFTNQIARKVVICRLMTTTRTGTKGQGPTTTKKVMCRVGGGWQDLQMYMLNRQVGM